MFFANIRISKRGNVERLRFNLFENWNCGFWNHFENLEVRNSDTLNLLPPMHQPPILGQHSELINFCCTSVFPQSASASSCSRCNGVVFNNTGNLSYYGAPALLSASIFDCNYQTWWCLPSKRRSQVGTTLFFCFSLEVCHSFAAKTLQEAHPEFCRAIKKCYLGFHARPIATRALCRKPFCSNTRILPN